MRAAAEGSTPLASADVRRRIYHIFDDAADQIVDATEGFSIVLCDLKTLLETEHSANPVRDKVELITQSS
jgi:hypothetical protein